MPRLAPALPHGPVALRRPTSSSSGHSVSPPKSAALDWWTLGGVVTVLLLASAFRLHALGNASFNCDELYAVRIQGFSLQALGSVLGRDAFHTNHPPLMTVPYLYWTAIFGTSEAAVRMLPLLCGLITVLLVYRLGYLLNGPLVGFLAATLLALNPLHIAYSREARNYAALVLFVTAAHLLLVHCLRTGQVRYRIGYAICCLLALFTHYFAVPALAPHGVIALCLLVTGDPSSRRNAATVLLTLTLVFIPFLAWVPVIPHQAAIPWHHLAEANWTTILRCLSQVAGLGHGLLLVPAAAASLALVGLGLAVTRQQPACPGRVSSGGGYCTAEIADPKQPTSRFCRAALVLSALAWVSAGILFFLVPKYVFPLARRTLSSHGYAMDTIQEELALIHYLLVAFPVAVALISLALYQWSRLVQLLNYLASLSRRCEPPLSVSGLVGSLLVVPIILVRLLGFLHIPFLQTRNLLILTPPLCLAVALGLAYILEIKRLRWLAGVALVCLGMGLGQYEHAAALFGATGYKLNIRCEPWRELAKELALCSCRNLPVVTTDTPSTDPILYYLDGHPQRLAFENDSFEGSLPGRFVFVDVTEDWWCQQTREHLRHRARRMDEMLRLEGLVVYNVELEADDSYR